MDTTVRPVLDNLTETVLQSQNTSSSDDLKTFTSSVPTIPALFKFGYTLGFSVTLVGICANAVVLGVLMKARRQFGSNVNTLIINQSLMDLLACFFVFVHLMFDITGRFVYNRHRSPFADNAVCILLEAAALGGTCMNAGKFGLVIITLERYFKIVHAIAHRKHYRDWMTSAGLVLPWISGLGWVLLPAIGTTKIVNGICLRIAVWPNQAMAAVRVFFFLFRSYEGYCTRRGIVMLERCALRFVM